MQAFVFNTTASIRFGSGASSRLGELARPFGSRTLLVTDAGLVRAGLIAPLRESLQGHGVACAVFDAVQADPAEELVLQAAQAAADAGAQSIIGVGGGSSLDVAKLVAVLRGGDQPLAQMYGVDNVSTRRLPLLLVPTTAGTGSEVTPISIVTTGRHEKKGVVSPVLLPDVALLDPVLTLGLPPHVTAATGVDAMVHAIEAYASASPNNNPISRGLAVQALQLLGANLRRAVADGQDLQARSAMLLGSMLAGQAFANSPVAAVHALAYPLGGHYGIAHGLSNALMLPHVLAFNAQRCAGVYEQLVPHLFPQLADAGRAGCQDFIDELGRLCRDIGLPSRLREVGIPQQACALLAGEAMKQTRLLVNNPRPLALKDALAIYRAAW
ncbi:iron-containing alcohol dehydrogenase [Orrella sp. JC864]|uniref:iron-containing alcohol dehydrogenase n=1 Tax=Orrella sp. JC864 TaxID=3120298 RepID=UPI003FA70E46